MAHLDVTYVTGENGPVARPSRPKNRAPGARDFLDLQGGFGAYLAGTGVPHAQRSQVPSAHFYGPDRT